jgi:ribosomal protein S1
MPNPWDTVAERYIEGNIYTGKVVRLATFGAFVELEPGVDGLVHVSQLADHRVGTPSEVVQVGDIVHVKVLYVDVEAKRISLSKREADEELMARGEGGGEAGDGQGFTVGEHLAAYHAGNWEEDDQG